jgi:hypothetical protein
LPGESRVLVHHDGQPRRTKGRRLNDHLITSKACDHQVANLLCESPRLCEPMTT